MQLLEINNIIECLHNYNLLQDTQGGISISTKRVVVTAPNRNMANGYYKHYYLRQPKHIHFKVIDSNLEFANKIAAYKNYSKRYTFINDVLDLYRGAEFKEIINRYKITIGDLLCN